MRRKDKPKKISAKKERYLKFRKEKPSALTIASPELTENQTKERVYDEQRISDFWRHYRRPPEKFVNERKARSKR